MDEDLALIIVAACIKSSRDIGDLSRMIPADRKDLKVGVAEIVYKIHENICDVLFHEFPTLKEDMERRLAKYDRLI